MTETTIFDRADMAEALQDVPPRLRAVFEAYVTACAFDASVHTLGSEHAKQTIAGALAKVRDAQAGKTASDEAAKDTRTPDQRVRDETEKRFGKQKTYGDLQRLMAEVRREMYPPTDDPLRHGNPKGVVVKREGERDYTQPRDPMADLIAANRPTNSTSGMIREMQSAMAAAARLKGSRLGDVAEGRALTLRQQIEARGIKLP